MDPAPLPPTASGTEVAPGVHLPEGALRFSFSRSSGPGGQNVNKLSTKARLHVALSELAMRVGPGAAARLAELAGPSRLTADGDLVLSADESRSQHANRQACLDRLRQMLVEAMRPRRHRRKTKPSRAAKARRLDSKRQRSEVKRGRGGSFD